MAGYPEVKLPPLLPDVVDLISCPLALTLILPQGHHLQPCPSFTAGLEVISDSLTLAGGELTLPDSTLVCSPKTPGTGIAQPILGARDQCHIVILGTCKQ